MTKTFHGRHGLSLEFTFPDDAPPGDVLLISRKLQEIVDIVECIEDFERAMLGAGLLPCIVDEGNLN